MPVTDEAKRRQFGHPHKTTLIRANLTPGTRSSNDLTHRGGAADFPRIAPKNRSILQIEEGTAV
jgi:hypothetical protein